MNTSAARPEERQDILGVRVNPINLEDTLLKMASWLKSETSHQICLAPAHAIMDCVENPALLEVYNLSALTVADGMGTLWLLKLYGHRQAGRVYGPDLLLAACERFLGVGCRHYFYGGAPGVAEELATKLAERYPGLQVAGVDAPPFRPLTAAEEQAAIERLRTARAQIVWVGLGSPQQEVWISTHAAQLGVPLLVGVGAAFDFLSGNKPQAPVWLQRCGLEWTFRLLNEPRRLWRRYIRYPKFFWLALGQWVIRLVRSRNRGV